MFNMMKMMFELCVLFCLCSCGIQRCHLGKVPAKYVQTSHLSKEPAYSAQTSRPGKQPANSVQTPRLGKEPAYSVQTSRLGKEPAYSVHTSHLGKESANSVQTPRLGKEPANSVQTSRLGKEPANSVQTSRLGKEPANSVQTSRLGKEPANSIQTPRLGKEPANSVNTSLLGKEPANSVNTSRLGKESANSVQTPRLGKESANSVQTPRLGKESANSVQTPRLGKVSANSVQTSHLGKESANSVQTSRLGKEPANSVQTSRLGKEPANSVQTSRLGKEPANSIQTPRLGKVISDSVQTPRLGKVIADSVRTSLLGKEPANSVETDDLCDYIGNIANCSNRQLNYVPVLRMNTTVLYFINNTLGNLTDETFENVTYPRCCLEQLDITHNNIKHISNEAFRYLKCLKNLTLDKNDIPANTLKAAFSSLKETRLKILSLNNMSLQHISEDFFMNLNETDIAEVSMRINYLIRFNMYVFRHLRNLNYVDISRNFMFYLKLYSPLNVTTLILDFNRIDLFNYKNNCSVMPSIKSLHLVHNELMYLYQYSFICFPNIEYLDLSMNPIIGINSHVFANLPQLSVLMINKICGLSYIHSNAFSNKNVKYISLSSNNIHFEESTLSSGMFNGCENLKHLDLSGNVMIKTSQEYFNSLFQEIYYNVTNVSLTDNILQTFPKVLQTLPNLQYLYLDANELTYLDRGYYTPKLVYLNLYDNDITSVNEHSFPENFSDMHLVVNLGHNPFDCTCELLWFLDMFTEERFNETFQQSTEDYTCTSPPSKRNTNLTIFAKSIGVQSCLLASTTSLIILFSSSFLLILILTGTALYHYRWHFRYFLYLLRRNRQSTQPEDLADILYDAFVVYAVDDLSWVVHEAMPILEDDEHLQLCIHQRDFGLGTILVDNIIKCLNTSRKFIILLSNNFGRSQWCLFELALIQKLIRSRGQNLIIVVKLNSIDQANMTPSMFNLLTSPDCMEWTDDPRAKELFWTQLVLLVKQEATSEPNESS